MTRPPGQVYVRNFIIYTINGIPNVNINDYRLTVNGLVDNPVSLTYEDILKLPSVKITRDFHCVTKWSIQNVIWEGVSFKTIIDLVKVKPEARYVFFECLDSYTTVVPIEDLKSDDAILAYKMNNKPLEPENGFPIRPFIPHLYDWKSAKWLSKITFIEKYIDGYWESRGYHERGNVWNEERFKSEIWKNFKKTVMVK
jgi:DMSO/TMAO reductase YedYZ molybdopterin-dependent catalytic subunit